MAERSCGCKGIRTCLLCEEAFDSRSRNSSASELLSGKTIFTLCPTCYRLCPGFNWRRHDEEPDKCELGSTDVIFEGLQIVPEFLSEEEEAFFMRSLDANDWDKSQSGRRKQNHGPKVNFNRRKMSVGKFRGFPLYAKFVHEKLKQLFSPQVIQIVEQCALEYDPSRGSAIDPHIDDAWIWGEKVISLNLLSNTFLCLRPYCSEEDATSLNKKHSKYNLSDVEADVIEEAEQSKQKNLEALGLGEHDVIIRVPHLRRSLVVLTGQARYSWEHFILRSDISERRICLAFRELPDKLVQQANENPTVAEVLQIARHFWNGNGQTIDDFSKNF